MTTINFLSAASPNKDKLAEFQNTSKLFLESFIKKVSEFEETLDNFLKIAKKSDECNYIKLYSEEYLKLRNWVEEQQGCIYLNIQYLHEGTHNVFIKLKDFTLEGFKINIPKFFEIDSVKPREFSMDTSPIVIESFQLGKRTLTCTPPLELIPFIDDQSIVIKVDSLNIFVFAKNRHLLIEELKVEIFLLWDYYARESPENLTPKAQELRKTLLSHFCVSE